MFFGELIYKNIYNILKIEGIQIIYQECEHFDLRDSRKFLWTYWVRAGGEETPIKTERAWFLS